ncbi:uncharacterized protein Dwil_GK27209 [Drosophila willistoni]|uniref:Zinc finger CCHC domain-containing protein 7 n=2 Tax=Drosophila willistoni TaxID=7260 RepID=A0A0Q9WQQ4_DROWI|nr:uncharacterized protein LOC26529211 [Drosophila willistoni]KRF98547.1 uncharacterized protein Dwil_GK27209 [Drosophila willistoni]
MDDLEDLDEERLNELESILYASIHYNDGSTEQQEEPTDSSQSEQQQHQPQQMRIVTNKRVINQQPVAGKHLAPFARPRYWDQGNKDPNVSSFTSQPATIENATTKSTADESKPKDKKMPPPAAKPQKQKNLAKKLQQQQQKKEKPKPLTQKQAVKPTVSKPERMAVDDEPERFDQRLLVAIPNNYQSPAKKEKSTGVSGPFGKSNRKLEQMQRLAAKQQKSRQVLAKKKQQQQLQDQKPLAPPIAFIDLKSSEGEDDDDDDVVHVPLPPVPVIDLDTSDGEGEISQPSYHEENAMDAADVEMGTIITSTETEEPIAAPSQHSPCSSVMSSDDFIVQKDTSRLMADRARATDEDLLVLTENAIKNITTEEEPQPSQDALDTSSEYEFVPPSRLEEIKQNYRVDEQQFRALDVYESESDLTESGIYAKVKPKNNQPTIIRNVDSNSDSSNVEEVIDPYVNKTKRLRKRRSSSTNHSQSEANNDDDDDDDDEDENEEGVHSTGVPGIARGMAVERCKRKIRRLSHNRRQSEDLQKQKQKSKGKAASNQEKKPQTPSSESASEEDLPSAREIAERLLQQKNVPPTSSTTNDNDADEVLSIGSDANTDDEAQHQDAISERISAVFERIDAYEKRNRDMNMFPEDEVPCTSSTIGATEDSDRQQVEEDNNAQAEAEELDDAMETEDHADSEQESNEHPVEQDKNEPSIQVEHNLKALSADKEQARSRDLIGWNDEMCRFYNDSWHGEQFSVHKILKSMNPNRSEWRIDSADRYPVVRPRSNLKCNNCFEMGHVRSKCPRPRKPPVCSTCGVTGHTEPRCPFAICLGCGTKKGIYVQQCNKCSFQSRLICQLCKMRGHSTDSCPDKWRRYHSTTRSNVCLEDNVQYKAKQCSYCAGRGHLFENCRQRIGEYRLVNYSSQIISHQKIYQDHGGPLSILQSMSAFCDPQVSFHFNWSQPTIDKASYYAKFLKAVGLAKRGSMITERPNKRLEIARPKTFSKSSIQKKDISSNMKQQQQPQKPTTSKPAVPNHDLDSDSNYSFSEHFELPTSTTNEEVHEGENVNENANDTTMPDVIPLSQISDGEESCDEIIGQGISMCISHSKASSSSTDTVNEDTLLPEVPSEGKILMARDQIEYLFSPEGRNFLAAAAKQCKVNVRMDFKDYGYVLVIYGLKQHQEDLQLMLMRRHHDVKRKCIEFQSQKPPKRIDVLIRFMRDGINSLRTNLGNAQNHYNRIKELEGMNTKNGYKLAEKKRRQLNMILLGQAGLMNGDVHLDQLLLILTQLIQDHSPDGNASLSLRNDIEQNWRMIFTAFPHADYESLLYNYGKLEIKNRLPSLKIDPMILGLSGSLVHAPPPPSWPQNNMAPPPPPPSSSSTPSSNAARKNRVPQKQQKEASPTAPPPSQLPSRRTQLSQMPFNNPEQRARFQDLQLQRNSLNPECVRLLSEMDHSDSHSSINTDAKKPSMFWSRESFKYLDDLLKMTSSPETLERLDRVLARSRRGLLSYNDYRAVIRLHSLLSN